MSVRAFSLIEIVVAIAILLVLVVAVIGALSQSARTMKGASLAGSPDIEPCASYLTSSW